MSNIKKIWTTVELRRKLLFTILMLIVFRLGCSIPVPYVSSEFLKQIFESGNILSYMNTLSGGALSQCALFALGVGPYINASIIVELLAYVVPRLKDIKEMENGQKEIEKITTALSVVISIIMAFGYVRLLTVNKALTTTNVLAQIVLITCFVAGSQSCMFIGNLIDSNGIGNGVSLLIFAGIVSGWSSVTGLFQMSHLYITMGLKKYYVLAPMVILISLLSLLYAVYIDGSEKRIPVIYSQNMKIATNTTSHLPMKLTMTGVLPIIFAVTLLNVPGTIALFLDPASSVKKALEGFNPTSWWYILVYAILIFAFNFFYSTVQFNPVEMANNLRTSGGTVPGVRPGKPTEVYLKKNLRKMSTAGSVALCLIAIIPVIVAKETGLSVPFAGSSLLIVVSVALESISSLTSYTNSTVHNNFLSRRTRRGR